MKRKAFLNRMLLAGGGIVLLPSLSVLNGCEYAPTVRTNLTDTDIPLLDEIGETIIPSSGGTPGAKAANIGAYMMLMVQDCYTPRDREIFLNGLNSLETVCAKQYRNSFVHYKWRTFDLHKNDFYDDFFKQLTHLEQVEKTVKYLQNYENKKIYKNKKSISKRF